MSYIICNIFFLSAVALLIDSRLRVGRLICWFNSCGVCHLPFQVKSSQVAFNKTMTIALHVQTRRIKKRQQKNTMSRETQKNSVFDRALPTLTICHPSGSQQPAAGSSELLAPVSGTPCRKRRHQYHH